MTDVLTNKQRKFCMSRIKGKDTKPELLVRRLVYSMGFRYRLHQKKLPGTPDLVFPHLKKVIFVHGCFWHSHNCRYGRVKPQTNASFWKKKRMQNKERDIRNRKALKRLGWDILIIWECQIKKIDIDKKISHFLSKSSLR